MELHVKNWGVSLRPCSCKHTHCCDLEWIKKTLPKIPAYLSYLHLLNATTDERVDPVCVSIRPSFLFIDVSVIGLSETQYHTIVKICHPLRSIHLSGFPACKGECNGQTYTNELSTSLTSVFAVSRQVTMVGVFYNFRKKF